MDPKQALEKMCHTSTRDCDGDIYTIADLRYPDYNGKQIRVQTEYGSTTYKWV